MAQDTLTGLTEEELEDRRETYEDRRERRDETDERPPFEERFCLWKIPFQPDWYDGPPRYCMKVATEEQPSRTTCDVHYTEGFAVPNTEDLTPRTAAITHGMNAKLENLRRDFSEEDKALYDWIVDSYAEAYDIDVENDPASAYDLHRLAAEVVRAERGRYHVLEEGEVHEKDRYSSEGQLIVDDRGEVVTEKSEHYLHGMLSRQDKKLTELQRELLVSRKERARQGNAEEATEGIKKLGDIGEALIARSDNEYDAEEWEDNATDDSG